jgi:hypothetical protein
VVAALVVAETTAGAGVLDGIHDVGGQAVAADGDEDALSAGGGEATVDEELRGLGTDGLGVSIQPRRRFYDHTREPWWSSARRHTIEWIEDRREAERRERAAIQTEGPLWNREHMDPESVMPQTRAYVADIRDGKVH